MNFSIIELDETESTNSDALEHARLGAAEGVCVIARRQTSGRGRLGRKWVSEKDSGLYFSIILRPTVDTKYLPLLTLLTGIAVHESLRHYRIDADIKWVNDILVNDKKIAGILAETADTPRGLAVVVGIGINLASRNMSSDLAGIATSMESETGSFPTPGEMSGILTGFLSTYYRMLLDGETDKILEGWRQRSSYYSGKPVRVTSEGRSFEGITAGLEANGALKVRLPDGSMKVVQAGDVQRLRAASTL